MKIIKQLFSKNRKKSKTIHNNIFLSDINDRVGLHLLEQALDFLISIEPDPLLSPEDADKIYEKYKEEIKRAKEIVRLYGEQIELKSLDNMQRIFYQICNSKKYQQSTIHASVVYSVLNYTWHGIGPWRA